MISHRASALQPMVATDDALVYYGNMNKKHGALVSQQLMRKRYTPATLAFVFSGVL